MKKIKVKALSAKQKQRVKAGKAIRISKPIEGMGASTILVDPSRFNILTKMFDKDNTSTIILTPEELAANKEFSTDEMITDIEGQGLYKKKSKCKSKKKVVGGWIPFDNTYQYGDKPGFVNPSFQYRTRISALEYDKRV